MRKNKITLAALIVAISTQQLALANSSKEYRYEVGKERVELRDVTKNTSTTTASSPATNTTSGVLGASGSSSSAESCDDISKDVAAKFAEKVKAALPSSPEDNVSNAVAQSGALNTNQQGGDEGLFSFSLASMSITGGSIWAAIQEVGKKVVDKAKEVAMNAVKRAAETAITSAVSSVNRAYATQVAKISSKMGFGGSVLTSALSGVVPSITTTAGSCAMNMDSACLDKVATAVSQSIDQGTTAAVGQIRTEVNNTVNNTVSNAADRVSGAIRENAPDLIKDELTRVVSDTRREIYQAGQAVNSSITTDTFKNNTNSTGTNGTNGSNRSTNMLYGN